jgi:hypothetical protein
VTVTAVGETVVEVNLGVMASENQSQLITNQTALTYTVAVTNTGGYTDTYDITLGGKPGTPPASTAVCISSPARAPRTKST